MIHRVESLADPRVAAYRHVGDPAWLRVRDLFAVEGRLVVRRLLARSSRFRPASILLTDAAARAMADVLPADRDVYVCTQDELNALTGYNFHRGCLALGLRTEAAFTPEMFAHARLVIALEGIGNPDNIGGIFRTAAAFGAGGVVLDPACGDPLYRKAIRTSMGAVLRVPFARAAEWPEALQTFRARGFRVAALTPGAEAMPLDDFARSRTAGPVVVVAGAEGPGLTPGALAHADVRVRIEIDSDVDSLNVAVATAIALHALRLE